ARGLEALVKDGDECVSGGCKAVGGFMQIYRAQNLRQNRDVGYVAPRDIAGILDGLERVELAVRRREGDRGQCQRRRAGVEQARAIAKDVAAVIFPEGLAGQAGNTLVV